MDERRFEIKPSNQEFVHQKYLENKSNSIKNLLVIYHRTIGYYSRLVKIFHQNKQGNTKKRLENWKVLQDVATAREKYRNDLIIPRN